MGKDIPRGEFTREDRQRYREKVQRSVAVLSQMLSELPFDADRPLTGLEIELNLIDDHADPAMKNAVVLSHIANPTFQTELGQYNLEINVKPRTVAGDGFADYEQDIRDSLNDAEERAHKADAHIVMIGILPTLTEEHTTLASLSANQRYRQLNEEIIAARGEDLHIDIRGVERLRTSTDSIAPEAACTSLQVHMQLSPADYARYWNASQAIAGLQVALGANSPFLFGRELWRETRIGLFEQATDIRPVELKAQGVRPRVWFGERWITSVIDLYEENVRYFQTLLPISTDEDPDQVLRDGGVPYLGELRLHNGTIYRWNRPVYDIMAGRPHVRVENRVLPAGPTVVDMLANAAFYLGLTRFLADEERPVWTQLTFSAAEENFHAAARAGIDARMFWPRHGEVRVTELVLGTLLPMAYAGLDSWGVAPALRDRMLGIIEQRCATGRNGSIWQARTVHRLEEEGRSRIEALREMLRRYSEHMHSNEPVHTWPISLANPH